MMRKLKCLPRIGVGPMKLKPRGVRLTDTDAKTLVDIGGAVWLRHYLRSIPPGRRKLLQRNRDIRRLSAKGVPDTVIALKLGINRATVWRVRV